jgi:hypothetical protein
MIKNSVGSKLFRNSFFLIDGKKQDVLRNGDLSCAIYVSSILRLMDLIPEIHTTVKGTVKAMEKSRMETHQKTEGRKRHRLGSKDI